MRSTPWTTKHDQLLRDSAPEISGSSEAELTRIWNRVDTGQRVEAPRRRRSRLVVGAAAAAAVLATSAVAAADLYSAHTGRGPIDAEDLRLGGPGERLDFGAPDFAEAVTALVDDIPFPSDAAREAAIQVQLDDHAGARPGTGLVSSGALRAWLADSAICTWGNQWAAATEADDRDLRAEAIEMIQEAPTWPAVTAIDPSPTNSETSRRAHPAPVQLSGREPVLLPGRAGHGRRRRAPRTGGRTVGAQQRLLPTRAGPRSASAASPATWQHNRGRPVDRPPTIRPPTIRRPTSSAPPSGASSRAIVSCSA